MRMIIIRIIIDNLGNTYLGGQMSFHIKAWLKNGDPQLQIIDAKSNSVCVSWSYESKNAAESGSKLEVQELFRELLLLTCKQEMVNCRIYGAYGDYEID